MARIPDLNLRTAWTERIVEQSTSGLTVAQYCELKNLKPGCFSAWKRRLALKGLLPSALKPNSLIPVRITEPIAPLKPITITFQCGAAIEISSDSLGEAIEHLLRAEGKRSEVPSC